MTQVGGFPADFGFRIHQLECGGFSGESQVYDVEGEPCVCVCEAGVGGGDQMRGAR